jgi:uncharacterized membrane protein
MTRAHAARLVRVFRRGALLEAMNKNRRVKKRAPGPSRPIWKRVIHYFFRGLIVLAPITVTVGAIYWVFATIDGVLRPYIHVPGIGFLIIIAFTVLVGWVSSFFLMDRLIRWFDQWLERMPGIKVIYTSVRDFFEALTGSRKNFNRTVLVNVFADEVWIVGFLTDEDLKSFHLGAEYVSVYVPQAYNFAGQLYMVNRKRVRLIEQVSSGEAMKYAVTGGVGGISVPDDKSKGRE